MSKHLLAQPPQCYSRHLNKVPVATERLHITSQHRLPLKRILSYCTAECPICQQQRQPLKWQHNLEKPPSPDSKVTIFRILFIKWIARHLLSLGHIIQLKTCLPSFLCTCETICGCPDHCHHNATKCCYWPKKKKNSLNNKQNKQYVDEFHWSHHVLHDQMALLKT